MASSSIQKENTHTPSAPNVYPKISGFTIHQQICDGPTCNVYKAKQDRLGRTVALKIMAELPAPPDNALERFNRASIAYAQIIHANLPALFETGTRDGFHYTALEYVHGWTLHELILQRKKLSEPRAISIALHIARGLSELHIKGIIHRNLKPKNILVGTDGHAQIVGLGLAKCPANKVSKPKKQTIGTPHYMAPEVIHGHPYDPRCDLYALGITLYAMVTGQPPFHTGIPAAIMAQHLYVTPPDLRSIRPDLSKDFIQLIEKLLQKDPQKRIQSAQEAHRRLEKISNSFKTPNRSNVSDHSAPSKESFRQKAAFFGGAMSLVFLFGIALLGIGLAFRAPKAPPTQPTSKPSKIIAQQVIPTPDRPNESTQNIKLAAEEFEQLIQKDDAFRMDAMSGISAWSSFLNTFPTMRSRYRNTAFEKIRLFRKLKQLSDRRTHSPDHPWIGDEEF